MKIQKIARKTSNILGIIALILGLIPFTALTNIGIVYALTPPCPTGQTEGPDGFCKCPDGFYAATDGTCVDVPPADVPPAPTDVLGCTDSTAFNFNAAANKDDGSCVAKCAIDSTKAANDPTCAPPAVPGCMTAGMFNFNPNANTADDSCIAVCEWNTTLAATDPACVAPANACGKDFPCNQPAAQPTWDDGVKVNVNLSNNGVIDGVLTSLVSDNNSNPTTKYFLECGEPNITIGVPNNYNMILMDITNPAIQSYYDDGVAGAGAKKLENLNIAVNVAQRDGWYADISLERQVYWNVLGFNATDKDVDTTTAPIPGIVTSIQNGSNDTVLKNVSIYFLMPNPSNDGVTPAPTSAQLTFIKYCAPEVSGCTNPNALNYSPTANKDDGTCITRVVGCMDKNALNYNPNANTEGACTTKITGCMDSDMFNYDSSANFPGTCTPKVFGCTDKTAFNYDPSANTNNDSCIPKVTGCMDVNATNYDKSANIAGTCTYPPTTPPLTIVPLLIPVTGNTCVPDVITAGIGHTCAVTPETGLRCWGQNDSGQLGDGSKKANTTVPVKVKVLDGGEVVQLVSGTKHTCALTTGGDVMCWGLNYSGQLGDGTTTNSNIPVKVKGLEGTIVSISAGENFTCAVNSDNKTMCWGNNSGGQFKNGNTFSTSTPVVANLGSDVKLVSGGQSELQGVTSAGAIQFWSNQPAIPVTGLTNDVALVSADRFSEGGCAMTTEGKVECWGAITASEITNAKIPAVLETGKKTCKVDPLITGEGHGCTITKDNGLVCWGKNGSGQLGNGTQKDSETPVEVTGIRDVIHLAAGFDHTCAIVDQETIKCWGQNTYGQLGNGTTKESSLPVLVK